MVVETIVRPGGFVAEAHVHPYQAERFEVLEGRLGLRVGTEELLAGPGDVATVEPGTPHRFWNGGERSARRSRWAPRSAGCSATGRRW